MIPLLYVRYCMLRNFFRHLGRQDYLRFAILGSVFALVIAAGAGFATYGFSFIRSLPAMGEVVTGSLIELLFFILFHLLVISNLLVGYTYLFQPRRSHLSFSLPVAPGNVFLLRASEAVFQSSWASFVLVGAVLVSYGTSFEAGATYFLFLPVILGAFLLLCGGIGITAAFLLGLLRRRFGRKAFAIGGATLFLLGVSYLAGEVRTLSFRPGEELLFFTRLTSRLQTLSSPFWPGRWAANAVAAFSHGVASEGFFALGLLTSSAFLFWPVWDLLGRFPYLRLWQDLHGIGGRAQRRRRIPPVRSPLAGAIRKDLLLFVRDPTQTLQLLLFLLLMGLYSLSLLRFPKGLLPPRYMNYVAIANIAAISFILGSFSSRFVYPLLGVEGPAVWVFAVAPLAGRVILQTKLVLGLCLMVPSAVGLAAASHAALGIAGTEFLLGTALVTALACALVSLSLAFSATFAEFTSDRPGEVLGTMGGTSNFLASSGLVVIVLGLWIVGVVRGRGSALGLAATALDFLLLATIAGGGYLWATRRFRNREY